MEDKEKTIWPNPGSNSIIGNYFNMDKKEKLFGPNPRSTVFTTLLNLRLELLKKQVIGKVGIITVSNAFDEVDILYQATGIIKNVYVKNTKYTNTRIIFVFDTGPTFTKFVKKTYTQNFPDGQMYALLRELELNPDKEHIINKSWGILNAFEMLATKFEILCI